MEHEFCCSALPVSLVGMNAELMGQYIKYVADRLLIELQCEKLYNTPNPFDWMEMISLQVRGTRTTCNSPCALYTMCSLMQISGTLRNAVVGMIIDAALCLFILCEGHVLSSSSGWCMQILVRCKGLNIHVCA